MNKRFLPQEGLKLIACLSMLLDHTGAVLFPKILWLRIAGRLAFPIYCYLLTEGFLHTRSPMRYAGRLALAAVLSELPFDLAFRSGWNHQNVMFTLLLGLCAMLAMKNIPGVIAKWVGVIPFLILAQWMHTDYSHWGVLLIVLMYAVRGDRREPLLLLLVLSAVFLAMGSGKVPFLGLRVPIQIFAIGAWVPIQLCSGRRLTRNRAAAWAFYLFYPVHLTILMLLSVL